MVRKIASQTGWWREHGPLLSQKWSHLSFGPGKHNHLSFGWHTHITPLAYPQPSCPKNVSKKPKKCPATIAQIILSLHLSMGKQHNAPNSFRPLMISRFARLWLVVRSKSHLACDQQSPCFLSHASLQLFVSQQGDKYYDKYFVPRFLQLFVSQQGDKYYDKYHEDKCYEKCQVDKYHVTCLFTPI